MAYYLDYSTAKLSGDLIKASGYTGVIRYIDAPNLLRTKHTDLAEYQDHIVAGLVVRLVMQVDTDDADGGFPAGVALARRAKEGADYLGYSGVVFFTNDRPELPSPDTWAAFLDGAASIMGLSRTGAYGHRNAILEAHGHAAAFWQAGRQSDLTIAAHYWQDNNTQVRVGGVLCDRNLVIGDYSPPVIPVPPFDTNESVETMEVIQVAASPSTTSIRIRSLPGTKASALIIRPKLEGSGTKAPNPVWIGHIFAWGSDGIGVGGDPATVAGYPAACYEDRTIPLPNAVWCDFMYSCNDPFEIQVVG
jgi:hypothetical protein